MPVVFYKLHEELENQLSSYIKRGNSLSKSRRSLKRVGEPPRYREAYPQLDIMQAKAAFDRGDIICDFTDRFDDPLGVVRFDLRENLCQVEYEIRIPYTQTSTTWDTFELTPVPNGIVKDRVMILCPGCQTKKKILFFKDKWRCASCLGLLFRSQLIHPLSRKWENFETLANKLRGGKPHGMHNRIYIGLLDELETLRQKVYGMERSYASDKYSDFVKCIWRPPVRRDEVFFPGIKLYAKFVEEGKAERELATRALINPISSNGDAKREFLGGFETGNPNDL